MSKRKQTPLDSWLKAASKPSEENQVGQPAEISKCQSNTEIEMNNQIPITLNMDDEKCQPPPEYAFPRDGNKRSLKHAWFSDFKWIHYVKDKDCVLCYQCANAVNKGMKVPKGSEQAFIKNGFKNWKKGPERFRGHEKSEAHRSSAEFLIHREKNVPIINLVNEQSLREQKEARQALKTIISSIRYLARTGQALRGNESDQGNLIRLLEERCEDVPYLKTWIKKRNNWLDGKIQNEIIEIMAHSVQRELIEEIKKANFYGIIADGTTDIEGHEQFSLCIRFMQENKVKEQFMGMYTTSDTKSKTLFQAIKDILVRLGLGFEKVRGHCFDGAPVMSGNLNGVQKLITEIQPNSVFVHCSNHSLDLCLQEAARSCSLLCEALALVKDVSNIILSSAKRKQMFSDIVLNEDNESNTLNLLPLCPTRWCVRVKSLVRFVKNYERIIKTVVAILEERNAVGDERRAALKGYKKSLHKAKTLFSLKVAICIFGPCEELATALQSVGCTVTKAKKSSQLVAETLNNMRKDDKFDELWTETKELAGELDLKLPEPKRPRKLPRRYEYCDISQTAEITNATTHLKRSFFEAIDIIVNELEKRFNQKGMENLMNLEGIITDSANGVSLKGNTLQERLGVFTNDFNTERLQAQLVLLPSVLKERKESLYEIFQKLMSESPQIKYLMDEVLKVVELLSVVPASAATAERSFSTLRRVKTYLRSRMSQKRLTHLLLLSIHELHTSNINLEFILTEFVSRTGERKSVFGS